MRYQKSNERRAVILMVVLSLLTLFALVGITFVLYADAEAAAARVAREAETAQRADVDPQQALSFFLSQLIYDANDTTGIGSGLRGHSLSRTMYGCNYVSGTATMGSPIIALTNTLDLSNAAIFPVGTTVIVSSSTNPSLFLTPPPPNLSCFGGPAHYHPEGSVDLSHGIGYDSAPQYGAVQRHWSIA